MTDRPTGRTVKMELVWVGDMLFIEPLHEEIGRIDAETLQAWCMVSEGPGVYPLAGSPFPTRSAAERAVEDAVIAALTGGGDE